MLPGLKEKGDRIKTHVVPAPHPQRTDSNRVDVNRLASPVVARSTPLPYFIAVYSISSCAASLSKDERAKGMLRHVFTSVVSLPGLSLSEAGRAVSSDSSKALGANKDHARARQGVQLSVYFQGNAELDAEPHPVAVRSLFHDLPTAQKRQQSIRRHHPSIE